MIDGISRKSLTMDKIRALSKLGITADQWSRAIAEIGLRSKDLTNFKTFVTKSNPPFISIKMN